MPVAMTQLRGRDPLMEVTVDRSCMDSCIPQQSLSAYRSAGHQELTPVTLSGRSPHSKDPCKIRITTMMTWPRRKSPLNELRVAVTMKMVPRTPPSTEPGRQQVSRLQRSHLHSAAIAEFFAFVLSQVVAALGVGEGLVSEGPFAFY